MVLVIIGVLKVTALVIMLIGWPKIARNPVINVLVRKNTPNYLKIGKYVIC